MDDVELLSLAIDRSGLSARKFAELVLVRDERTIRRWLKGESPIPKVVREMLQAQVAKPEGEKRGRP